MKKVAIVTIESMNYGNRLQNYALQEVLQSIGCDVETFHREIIQKGMKKIIKRLMQNIFRTKALKFRQFDSNIKFSNILIGRDDYPDGLSNQFDYFVVGSDQVWNPYYDFVAGKCDFLMFANDRQRISYAASFGVSDIPREKKREFAERLSEFRAISVREKQGAKIIRDLTGREVTVTLDPTLLLDENKWRKVERIPPFCPKHNYAFVYALGDKSEQFQEKIEQLKGKYEIFDVRAVQKNGRERPVGPSEFLYLIRNAEEILTDSFHATVFSIIFHKKFVTFNRPGLNMNSRIESLAELVGIVKYMTECGDLNGEEIDYVKVDEILEEERRKSIDFLKNSLTVYNNPIN